MRIDTPLDADDVVDSVRQHREVGAPKRVALVLTGGVWLLAIANLGRQVRSLWGVRDLGFDANIYAAAAHAASHGLSPYSIPAFIYPPSCVVLVWPLAWLPSEDVPHAGLLLTAPVLVLLAVLSGRAAGDRWFGPRTAIVLLVLTLSPPTRAVLALGNLSAVVAAGFATFVLLASRNRWTAAGLALGVTLAIKPMLAPVLIVFVLEKRWKGLGAALAVPAASVALAMLVVREPWRFLSQSLPFISGGGASGFDAHNAAIAAVSRTVGWPRAVAILAQVLTAVAVYVAVALVQKHEVDRRARVLTTASLLMAGALLVGTLSEDHYVLVLVPLFAAVCSRGSYLRWWSAVVCYVLVAGSISDRLAPYRTLSLQTKERAVGLAVVIVVVLVEALLRQDPRSDDEGAETEDSCEREHGESDDDVVPSS